MSESKSNRQVMLGIMLGLVAWGCYLAVGNYVQHHNLLGSLIIIGCVALFLAFWLAALAVRRARRDSDDEADSDDETDSD